jgi:hypothetical protein
MDIRLSVRAIEAGGDAQTRDTLANVDRHLGVAITALQMLKVRLKKKDCFDVRLNALSAILNRLGAQ